MQIGLLWYHGDPSASLEVMIGPAANRYRAKFGSWPDTAHLHPSVEPGSNGDGSQVTISGECPIRCLPSVYVQPEQVWIGERTRRDKNE